jgi:acetolactate synthase-1/3 small subunit
VTDTIERNTFAVLVDNEPGVLARVIGLFSGRGYNIESLTVAAVDDAANRSRITLVTSGTRMVVEQIEAQLNRLVPSHRVANLTRKGPCVERELALVKVRGTGIDRIEAMRIAEIFRARAVDTKTDSFIFEITGNSDKINAFIELMQPLGLVEIARTGVAALGRGGEGI